MAQGRITTVSCFIITVGLSFLVKYVSTQKTVDSMVDFPTYDKIYKIVRAAADAAEVGWNITNNMTLEESKNITFIQKVVWPKILTEFSGAHVPIKEMDLTIRFTRKPAIFLDSLLGFTSIEDIQKLSRHPKVDPFGNIKLRWIEISAASTQMERFYNKRIKDILNGGQNMREILNSFKSYASYIWKPKLKTSGIHENVPFADIPETAFNLMFLENGTDAFEGLKRLMDTKVDVLNQPVFDLNSCGPGQEHIRLEPNGNDIPFYLLFYCCLVDIKYFIILNFMHLYNKLIYKIPATNQSLLVPQMQNRIHKKVELFDQAFGAPLLSAGPSYSTHPGLTNCDPKDFVYGVSYEKLTNFIKVFVSPETALHKSGTCRPTCDLLDVTYSVCGQNETDCKLERERECLADDKCDNFNPVCPTGAYQCQNSSGLISACPSKRFDRLYEFIKGQDVDDSFHFGPKNKSCVEELNVWKGGWRMEQDVLVDTPHFCEICVCYCFEPLIKYLGSATTRYFSLRSVRSNLKKDRIIVGLKFHRVKDQIHIATADADLLPGNRVNQSTVTWNYPKYEEDKKFLARLNMDLRSLNLDDVVTNEPDRVVTGVRFYADTYVGAVTYNYIGLEILTHQVNRKGIIQGTGVYVRNGNSTVYRRVYQYGEDPLNGPNDPIYAPATSLPDSASNMYIAFRGTSLEKDAAQSTIPYFDAQPLISPEPSALKGIGVIHKSSPGYGGFLAFKIIEHRLGM